MQTDGQTGGQKCMTKLIIAFRSFANASKTRKYVVFKILRLLMLKQAVFKIRTVLSKVFPWRNSSL
jgi:hypothetical protein